MTTILNFLPIVSGGGLQNSLGFIRSLACRPEQGRGSISIVRRGSLVHAECEARGLDALAVRPTNWGRMVFELTFRRHFQGRQACFTMFGPPLLLAPGYLTNINGCAYSNLFYPEINFWAFMNRRQRRRQELVDRYRWGQTIRADFWLFETETLRNRAVERCGFPEERVAVVPMAASSLVGPAEVRPERQEHYDRLIRPGYRVLFLCGAQPNKRIDRLPAIARALRDRGAADVVFVTTMAESHPYTRQVASLFSDLGVPQYWSNIGPVPPADVSSLIAVAKAMGTLSRLESFSNNFVEAWKMNCPLVVTDADWARESCAEAALYVDPEDPTGTAERLIRLRDDEGARQELVRAGIQRQERHPTSEEKTRQLLDYIEKARELGPCPAPLRQKMRRAT